MTTLVEQVPQVVFDTFANARAGDIEAIGWILVAALSVILAVVIVLQLFSSDAQPSSAKTLQKKALPPPSYNVGLPLIGNLISFVKDPLGTVNEAYEKKGPVFTIRLLTKRLTFLIGSKASETFFKASDLELDQNEPYRFTIPVFGKDVVYDATLENRLQHLRILSMSLRVNMLEAYVPIIVNEVEEFFASWANEGEIDLYKEMANLTILTGSRCIMGREVRENLFSEVSHLLHDLDQGMQPISVLANWLPTEAHRTRDRARKQLGEVFKPIIKARRNSGKKEDDILQWFIDARYKDGTPYAEHEVVGLLVSAIFAAQHTSSAIAAWVGMRLLRDKQVLAEVMEEQETVMKENNGELGFQALLQMNLLHACIKETLRMHPPLIFLMRKALEPRMAMDGQFRIPENDFVVTSPSIANMLPNVFKQPDKWDPYRFLPPREEDRVAPFSFLTFGAGRHGCMGEGFAYVQLKAIWNVLLKTFDLEPVGEKVPKANFDALVIGPKMGTCMVKYKRKTPLPS